MSFWDNMKKFAQPYADDDYDDYDDEEEYFEDDYESEERAPRRAPRRAPASDPAPMRDEEEEEEDEQEEETRSSFSFPSFSTSGSDTKPAPASTGFVGQVMGSSSSSNKQEVVLFRPGSFNDTSKAADDLRNRKAVIVNMENVDKAMARRVVDFLSGCVYALDGDVKKIAQSAYLFCPHNLDIVGDLETLQAEVESYV